MGKASIEEQTETYADEKKAFSLLLMPLQLMEITLNCFRIHICIMTLPYIP